jgi:tetratricopeptide (TPR) repeat protein
MKKYSANLRGLFLLLTVGLSSVTAFAQDYLGADAVLHQVESRIAKPVAKKPVDAQSQLRAELKTFSQTATNLTPAAAAKQWLNFVDRARKLAASSAQNYNQASPPIGAEDLLGALPPPTDWSELAKAIAARPPSKQSDDMGDSGLHLLAATLTSDPAARDLEITNLQTKAQSAVGSSVYFYRYRRVLQQISQTMLAQSDDPDAILKTLEYELTTIGTGRSDRTLVVPNLVSQIGAAPAEAFLRKALVTPNVVLEFRNANDTSRLAQKLAVELVAQLKSPQWGLVNSLNTVELYEALDKRFNAPTNPPPVTGLGGLIAGAFQSSNQDYGNNYQADSQKNVARVYYMLGLISHDRAKEAVVVAKKLNGENGYYFSEAFQSMQRAGYTSELDNFFYELLTQNPTLPFWDQYVELAANAGTTDRMLALVRQTITGNDLNDAKKSSLHEILFKALLAADKTDDAVVEMRQLIAAETSPPESGVANYNHGQLGALLAQLGMLMQKPEWITEGLAAAKKWLATPDGQNFQNGEAATVLNSVVKILTELHRGPEAEALLTDALANASRPNDSQDSYQWDGPASRKILAALAALYHQAGRPADVLQLLQQAPGWGAEDVSDLWTAASDGGVTVMWLHTGLSPVPMPYLAADALLATGQKEPARKINEVLLSRFPGLDHGYELLLALDGTNAMPELDQLFAGDQFEERPLIWKAHLLRLENRLDEAEKTIRQAIAIDPSDGEEGRGDRMRAYAELAEILDARGNKKDADEYREVIKAIRLSEDADQFYAAGLLKRAIGMYKEGLNHFSDAYCIQSRLAIQLSALGMNAEAEEHYRRAYELMPDSFGRVESHCFGCEKAFDGEHAQGIAEKVFSQLAIDRPDKPQVHYLLGYLRFEQDRFNEARTNFLTATKLDPDYLNAWIKVQEADDQTLVPAKERNEIAFNIIRLDPLNRHGAADYRRVTDLVGLWNVVTIAASRQPPVVADLYPLTASKLVAEKKSNNSPEAMLQARIQRQMESNSRTTTPANAIGQTPMMRLAGEMILNNGSVTTDD